MSLPLCWSVGDETTRSVVRQANSWLWFTGATSLTPPSYYWPLTAMRSRRPIRMISSRSRAPPDVRSN
ncbi:MAG: hypothetical protein DMD81_09010 [Candidatus Rokuibacteriota bacterium]|nr:MAG: hypothetical protein DMD81_09010 [Candidatus Rokubacteria bacterium]